MPYIGYIIHKMQWKKPELVSPFLHSWKGRDICQEPAVAIAKLAGNCSLLHSADLLCRDHVPRKRRETEHTHPSTVPVLHPSA